jgi:hypothetical protein
MRATASEPVSSSGEGRLGHERGAGGLGEPFVPQGACVGSQGASRRSSLRAFGPSTPL